MDVSRGRLCGAGSLEFVGFVAIEVFFGEAKAVGGVDFAWFGIVLKALFGVS